MYIVYFVTKPTTDNGKRFVVFLIRELFSSLLLHKIY